jgi:hypothetical protein
MLSSHASEVFTVERRQPTRASINEEPRAD